jgi:long-chain acyl-CoA synthetase
MQAQTLPKLLREACMKWTGRPAMLVRPDGEFKPISYSELYETTRYYAGVLKSLGLVRGDRLCIMSENCAEWAFVDWACQSLGVTVVTIYPSLPPDQVEYIVQDSGAKVLVAGDSTVAGKAECIEGLKVVLVKGPGQTMASLAAARTHEIPRPEWEAELEKAQPEDVATIIYTSGTTGMPKGVMLPHRAYTFLCQAALSSLPIDENDLFLSFLPMSHVYERFAGQVLPFSCGACVAYSKNLASLASDIQATRPTVMLCVPRFLEATMDKIMDGVRKQPPLRQRIFEMGLKQGVAHARGGFAPLFPVTDKLVGAKIRERLGGRMRFLVSGGAALPKHVAEFYLAMGLKVLQGYGLTETCAATCINHPDRIKYWTVGEPLAGMEVTIAPDGEILVRGQGVMLGYWNKPEDTAAVLTADGWFHTGDIGEFEGNYLKITDRKKDLLVLGNGKNVAPQPIENRLKESKYISEAVVLGDGLDCVVALIVPNFDALRMELSGKGVDLAKEDALMVHHAEARGLIKQDIDAINKSLPNYEMVKKHAIVDTPFSVESGELTPSMKVKRKVVKEKYRDLIATLS